MKIKYKGVKSRDGDYDLGQAALLQGDIGSGKSSLVAATHFALTGKVAAMRLGKGDTQDPGRLLKIADDGAYSEVEINGTTILRRLEATAKKARVQTLVNGKTGPEAEADAAKLAGDLIFADFGRLVAAGDTERAAILATYLPQPDDAEKRLWAMGQSFCHMEAAITPGAKKNKPNEPRIAGRLSKEVAKELRDKLVKLADLHGSAEALTAIFEVMRRPDVGGDNLVQLLREAANVAEDARKTANKVAEEAAKAGADEIGLAAEIPQLEEQVSALRSEVHHATKNWETWDARQKLIVSNQERLAEIAEELAKLDPKASNLEGAEASLVAATAAFEASKRAEPTKPDLTAMRTLELEVQGLQTALRDAEKSRSALETWDLQIEMFEAELAELTAQQPTAPNADIVALIEQETVLARAIDEALSAGKQKLPQYEQAKTNECPLMHIECPASLLEFAEATKAELNTLAKDIASLQATLVEAREKRAAAESQRRQYEAAQTAWLRRKDGVEAKLNHALEQRTNARAVHADSHEVEERLVPLMRELAMIRQRHEDFAASLARQQEAHMKAHSQLMAATSLRNDCVRQKSRKAELMAEDTKLRIALAKTIENHTDEPQGPDPTALQELEAKLKAAHAAKARMDVLGNANVDKKTAAATLWKAAHAGASAGLTACIQNATDPTKSKVTAALHKMGLRGEFFVDLEAKTFGVLKGGKLIDVETLSGGEKVLFAAAMLSSLPRRSGTRVLTLESAELPGKWLARMMEGIDIDAFDAVIVASCHVPTKVPARWQVITMQGGTDANE